MRWKRAVRLVAVSTLLLAVGIGQVDASIVIAGTRVVYDAAERESVVRLSNEGVQPALVQIWIDTGDAKASPQSIEVPFLVTPPVARVDPARGQTLRIAYTGEPLPQDRESVFWLNVLEVPPKPEGAMETTNNIQLAFRTRIKLFYRPVGLPGDASAAPSQLAWRLTQGNTARVLEVRNPTPYHVSFAQIRVESDAAATKVRGAPGMLSPGETRSFELEESVTPTPGTKVRFQTINDWGAALFSESELQPAR